MIKSIVMPKNIFSKIIKDERGSITVEAVFVMPVVVFAISALIYLAFYLHDYCRITATVDMVLQKTSVAVKHEAELATGIVSYEDINGRGVFYMLLTDAKDMEEQIARFLEDELSKGLFICHITKSDVRVGKLGIKITVWARGNINLPMFKTALGKIMQINLERTYPVHYPAETIRSCELILDTGSKIKGTDKLKEILDKFIN